jgi:hypothetical protein
MDAATAVESWRSSASATVLGVLGEGPVPAAIWQRSLDVDLIGEVHALAGCGAFRHRSVVDRGTPDPAIHAVLAEFGGAAAFPALARDLRQLLGLMTAVDGMSPRSLRLEVIDDDGCRLFHADRVNARLICTYVGTGTELVPDDAVDRSRMGQGDNRHVLDVARVSTVPTGAVLLMRGDLSRHGPGVLHRSPPNPQRLPRVLVAIDA